MFARLGDLGPVRPGRPDGRGRRLRRRDRAEGHAADPDHRARPASPSTPTRLLRMFRRLSFRSALTATLATRMMPVLAADSQRLAEAQRTRPGGARGGARGRVALLSAVVGGSLDRAMDVAATLEVRGFATPRRAGRARGGASAARSRATTSPSRRRRRRSSRWRSPGAWPAPPRSPPTRASRCRSAPARSRSSAALVAAALLPFCDRRGIDAMSGAVLSLRERHLPLPGRRAPGARRRQPEIAPGEFCLLAGLSGSGKSTLLRAACGLAPHFHGGRFAGRVHAGRPGHARARARRGSARSPARCFRTPRRSS